jgi:hypothetical protein
MWSFREGDGLVIPNSYSKTKDSPSEISGPLSLKLPLLKANRNVLLAGPVYFGLEIR